MADTIIEVSQLTKHFKGKTAVHKADFKIAKGEIFGLVGQNGAGKSTLLKMIGGLIYPTSGEIKLFDRAMNNNHPYFERIGLLIENAGLFPYYNAYENLDLISILYGLTNRERHIKRVLQLVGLDASNKTKVRNYSMGMKQRLGIAASLIGSPDILILDEPINGLDPQGISEIRKLILDLNKTGITIIISSHILEELSKVATQYAILHQGEIIENHSREQLLLQCEDRIEIEVEKVSSAVSILEEQLNINHYKVISDRIVYVYNSHIENQHIIKSLVENGVSVHSVTKHKQSLEQYFLARIGSEGGSRD
ncbi:ABC transporter ATP-binding protein [Paenibacillus nasutitermitis]|uniref:Bacitracin ABC transporter ATP-binding protein n=1 Tax=Paenibacillus nasutitermitis TaxID=1652958 RepID=A0A916Z2G6_9BACL|nr:ATP-binding cassette domain-containing protein [Paenibacillus nasutitermitis]GGD72877.1 bacitracin ABC transporter ATP-binding protein [Paenibacillus nasutitermitis]